MIELRDGVSDQRWDDAETPKRGAALADLPLNMEQGASGCVQIDCEQLGFGTLLVSGEGHTHLHSVHPFRCEESAVDLSAGFTQNTEMFDALFGEKHPIRRV